MFIGNGLEETGNTEIGMPVIFIML